MWVIHTHTFSLSLSYTLSLSHTHTHTQDVLQSMRTKLTSKIDSINHHLGCPLTPRDSQGAMVNCHRASAQELYTIVSCQKIKAFYTFHWPHQRGGYCRQILDELVQLRLKLASLILMDMFLSLFVQHQERKLELDQNITQTGSLQRKAALTPSSHSPHLFVQVNHVDHTFPEPCEVGGQCVCVCVCVGVWVWVIVCVLLSYLLCNPLNTRYSCTCTTKGAKVSWARGFTWRAQS